MDDNLKFLLEEEERLARQKESDAAFYSRYQDMKDAGLTGLRGKFKQIDREQARADNEVKPGDSLWTKIGKAAGAGVLAEEEQRDRDIANVKALSRAPDQILPGLGQSVLNTIATIGEALPDNNMAANPFLTDTITPQILQGDTAPVSSEAVFKEMRETGEELGPEPQTIPDFLVRGVSAFALPFGTISKSMEGLNFTVKSIEKLPKVARSAAEFMGRTAKVTTASVAAEQFAFDPNQEDLFNTMSDAGIGGSFVRYLAVDPNDSTEENRLKLLIKGIMMEPVAEILMLGAKATKAKMADQVANETDKAFIAANDGYSVNTVTDEDINMLNSQVEYEFNPSNTNDDFTDPNTWEADNSGIGYPDDLDKIGGTLAGQLGLGTPKEIPELVLDVPEALHPSWKNSFAEDLWIQSGEAEEGISLARFVWEEYGYHPNMPLDQQVSSYHKKLNEIDYNEDFFKSIKEIENNPFHKFKLNNEGKVEANSEWTEWEAAHAPMKSITDPSYTSSAQEATKWDYKDNFDDGTSNGVYSPIILDGTSFNLGDIVQRIKGIPWFQSKNRPDLRKAFYGESNDPSKEGSGLVLERDPLKKYGPLGEAFWKMSEDARALLKRWRQSPPTRMKEGAAMAWDGRKEPYSSAYVTPDPDTARYNAKSRALVREIYNNGKHLRDYMRQWADKDGYVWLFRGTENTGEESPNSIRSYSLSPYQAEKFSLGTKIFMDKVHIRDMVNVGHTGEQEIIVRTTSGRPHREAQTRFKNVQALPGFYGSSYAGKARGTAEAVNDNAEFNLEDFIKAAEDKTPKTRVTDTPPVSANDNLDVPKADAEYPPPTSGKGYYIGRNENGDFQIMTLDGHYLEIPDTPGTRLNFDVQGLGQVAQKVGTLEYWARRFKGYENPDEILRIIETPTPEFKRNPEGTYVSSNGKYQIVKEGKSWRLQWDEAAGAATPVSGSTNIKSSPKTYKNLQEAQEAAAVLEKGFILKQTGAKASGTRIDENFWQNFWKRPGRQYTPDELDNIHRSNELFTTEQDAAYARKRDRIAKAGGRIPLLLSDTLNLLHVTKREVIDDALYFRHLTQTVGGFDPGYPEQMAHVNLMKLGKREIDSKDPFVTSGSWDIIEDATDNPYSTYARLASTGKRVTAFLNDAPLGHPGEPINIIGQRQVGTGPNSYTEDYIITPADTRAIRYPKKATKAFNKIWQPLVDSGDSEEFKGYLAAQRAKFLKEEREIDSALSKAEADGSFEYDKIINSVANDPEKATRFNKAIDDLQDYYDSVLVYYKDSGMLSEDAYARIREQNTRKNGEKTMYQPFYYVSEKDTTKGIKFPGRGKLKNIKGIEAETAEDAGLKLLDPWEAGVRYTHSLIRAADLNNVKKVAMRYVEEAQRRGHNVGIEFASPELTRAAAPNWSIQDSLEKQLKNLLGNDEGKEFVKSIQEQIGKQLNMETKEVSSLMDSGYTSLIAFAKGQEFTDKNGAKVFVDMFFDGDKGARLFKVTDPDAQSYFMNGGTLPDDPNEYYSFLGKVWKYGSEVPARAFGTFITHVPAFFGVSFLRDARGFSKNSVFLRGTIGKEFRGVGVATGALTNLHMPKAFTEKMIRIAPDREFLDQILNAGGSYTRNSEVFGFTNSTKNIKRLLKKRKVDALRAEDVVENVDDPWLRRFFDTAVNKSAKGGTNVAQWYRNEVMMFEMGGARAVEAFMATQLGMSDTTAATFAREVSTDLARRGASRTMNKFFAGRTFMRSGVQGVYRMSRRLRATGGGMLEGFTGELGEVRPTKDFVGPSLPDTRGAKVKRAYRNSGMDKFAMGLGSSVALTAGLAWLNNEYYGDQLRQQPDEIKKSFTMVPRFKGGYEQAAKDLYNGKIPELDPNNPFLPIPKDYDWGAVSNMVEDLITLPDGRSRPKAFVESVMKTIEYLLPAGGNLLPNTADALYDPLIQNQNQFDSPLPEANGRLGEDVTTPNTMQMSIDLTRGINEAYRYFSDKPEDQGKNVLTAAQMDTIVRALAPGFLSNVVHQMETTYRDISGDIDEPLDPRRFKVMRDNESKFVQNLENTIIGDVLFDVADRFHTSGNADLEKIYSYRQTAQNIAGSYNMRIKLVDEVGGEQIEKMVEEFKATVQKEDGTPKWRAEFARIAPTLNDYVSEIENLSKARNRVTLYGDKDIQRFYTQTVENFKDGPKAAETNQAYMRAYLQDKYSTKIGLISSALFKELAELPQNSEEFDKLMLKALGKEKTKPSNTVNEEYISY